MDHIYIFGYTKGLSRSKFYPNRVSSTTQTFHAEDQLSKFSTVFHINLLYCICNYKFAIYAHTNFLNMHIQISCICTYKFATHAHTNLLYMHTQICCICTYKYTYIIGKSNEQIKYYIIQIWKLCLRLDISFSQADNYSKYKFKIFVVN